MKVTEEKGVEDPSLVGQTERQVSGPNRDYKHMTKIGRLCVE